MKISVLALFPEALVWLRDYSMVGRAIERNALDLDIVRIRDFADDKHRKIDDYSFGGGPEVVMSPQPLFDTIANLSDRPKVYYLSPQGRVLDQEKLFPMKEEKNIVLLNGRYEGIDQRAIDELVDEGISIGDYVLSSGEMTNLVIIDGINRLLGGVLSSEESYMDESHVGSFLEFPQYTRSADFRGLKVSDVLLGGHHEKIENYRLYWRMKKTLSKRPDIFEKISLNEKEEKMYKQIKNNLEKGGRSN